MPAPPVWRLAAGQRLAHRGWDGEYVLYNDLSGDTHLLGEPALDLLLALRETPGTPAALASLLGTGAEAVGVLLAELEPLALVESGPC